MRVFVDTSGWVALFVASDIMHKRAASIYEELVRSGAFIYTSDYVIDETVTTILKRNGHRQSVLAGNAILSSDIAKLVYVAPDYLKSAWTSYQKYDDKMFSFTDVTSFVIIKKLDIKKAFSFDKDFKKVGIEIL
ncbi:type II toxin-antitoxin system VapC family toxin [Candidatus Auribacterota bacterium]